MEIAINTDFLTQEEFEVINQIKVNTGVRQQLTLLKEAQKEKAKAEKQPIVKRKRTKKKPIKMSKVNATHIKHIYEFAIKDKKPAYIGRKVGLRAKTVSSLVYRMKFGPRSKVMLKTLGIRKLTKLAKA